MRIYLCLLAVVVMAGCQPRPDDGVTHYRCGGYRAEMRYAEAAGTLHDAQGKAIPVMQTISASGVRFQPKDPGMPDLVFWNKGADAMLFVGEAEIIPCISETERLLMEGLVKKQEQQERLDVYRMQHQILPR